MTDVTGRPLKAQLTTARLLLAEFENQLREWNRMKPARRRSTARGRDLARRIEGLRQGKATWEARVADLEARIGASET